MNILHKCYKWYTTIPNSNSKIFKTKNNEFAIFGKTIDEVKEKWKNFVDIYTTNGHKLFGEGGAFSSLFSGKKTKTIITPELLSQFDDFKERFNNSKLSAEALAEEMGDVDSSIVNYAKTCKNGELTTEGFTAALQQQTLGAKAATVATKALAIAGNMLAMWAVTKGIELLSSAIDNLIETNEEYLEKQAEIISKNTEEINSIENQITSLKELKEKLDVAKDSKVALINLKIQRKDGGFYNLIKNLPHSYYNGIACVA